MGLFFCVFGFLTTREFWRGREGKGEEGEGGGGRGEGVRKGERFWAWDVCQGGGFFSFFSSFAQFLFFDFLFSMKFLL